MGGEVFQEEMRVLSAQALYAAPGIHAQESGPLRKVAGGETTLWELDDQMMGASLETDEVPEELRTEGRKSIFEKNFKKTVTDSGEKNLSEERVLRRRLGESCGRKRISQDRGSVTRVEGGTSEEDRTEGKAQKPKRKDDAFYKCIADQ